MTFDWNDLRYFAAVLEHGSTARAARELGVEQTTCARRIAALEAALGLELFSRGPGGYTPTPAGLALRTSAEGVAAQVAVFAREADTATRRAVKRLRITTDEFMAQNQLAPALSRLVAAYPDIQVEVDASSVVRDLETGEADVGIRAGPPPEGATLVRRKLRDDPWGVYCSTTYAAARGTPADFAQLADHPMVAHESAMPTIRELGLEHTVRQVVNSLGAVVAMIRSGACVGALPQIAASGVDDLRLCFPTPGSDAIWLVYPERLRKAPEVKALAGFLVDAFR
ncbi:MAG: LysR family transcriptional regulator [Phenylobacterium zucineum]|nr:MAG: LysR family transcriptional regulator [Phenylobacterium zucineum]